MRANVVKTVVNSVPHEGIDAVGVEKGRWNSIGCYLLYDPPFLRHGIERAKCPYRNDQ